MSSTSLWEGVINTRRGLLASLWTLVTALTFIAFGTSMVFVLSTNATRNDGDYYNYNENGEANGEGDPEIAVTSRALAFAALWTAVLATLLAIFGTVVLGWQSPTGQYYTCCSPQVHKTTPIAIGSFIGSLIMFANLTLLCSVLFGEFEIRDYREGDDRQREDRNDRRTAANRSSVAFSVMCMFLTVMYMGFAALTFTFRQSLLNELKEEERMDAFSQSRTSTNHFTAGTTYNNGYIGERFDVRRGGTTSGFVSPKPPEGALT